MFIGKFDGSYEAAVLIHSKVSPKHPVQIERRMDDTIFATKLYILVGNDKMCVEKDNYVVLAHDFFAVLSAKEYLQMESKLHELYSWD